MLLSQYQFYWGLQVKANAFPDLAPNREDMGHYMLFAFGCHLDHILQHDANLLERRNKIRNTQLFLLFK